MIHRMLQEFKPRKAAFGFKVEEFSIESLIPTGQLLEALAAHYGKHEYSIEFGVPFRARDIKLKVYTDDSAIAAFIRLNFTAQPTLP